MESVNEIFERANESIRKEYGVDTIELLKALRNETRDYILCVIQASKLIPEFSGGISVSEIRKIFGLNPASLEQHLKILEKAKLTKREYRKRPLRTRNHAICSTTDSGEKAINKILEVDRNRMLDCAAYITGILE